MDRRKAGALVAAGGGLFVLFSFGVPKLVRLLEGVAETNVPDMPVTCCGCFGILLLALPLFLLAMSLFREPPPEPPPS